ncbi:helix-turn-helix domain-containing protein [Elizabethkingia anophelis]|uniref:helix-turn-helix domain-containing protein n=1 Tax=Elizabethkingia anophelis TaxID=1117645 RepID=UPI0034627B2A
MANFDNSADMGKQLILKFIKKRMEEKNISSGKLASLIGVERSTLNRNLENETEMTVSTLFKICGALELRPYFIPAEIDKNELQKMFFS